MDKNYTLFRQKTSCAMLWFTSQQVIAITMLGGTSGNSLAMSPSAYEYELGDEGDAATSLVEEPWALRSARLFKL